MRTAVMAGALIALCTAGAPAEPDTMDRASWPLRPGADSASAGRHASITAVKAAPMGCVPDSLKRRLGTISRRWGKVRVISTFRRNATIRNTGRPSRHARCQAVDFKPPPGSYHAVAGWLKDNHDGGVGTYSGRLNHIHIDTGPAYRWHN